MKLGVLLVGLVSLCAAVPPPLPANVSVVAGGFSWIENLCFDGAGGSMFASERLRGQLLQVRASGGGGGGGYNTTVLLEGMWKLLLGCVVDSVRFPGTVFAVGELLNGSHVLAAVPVAAPSGWSIVAFTAHCGNGIRIDEVTGRIYTSTEGAFLPGTGAVYEIDPSARPWGGPARVLVDGLAPADGLWIDQAASTTALLPPQRTLYVGLLPSSRVWAYDLAARAALGTFSGLKHDGCELLLCAMDDFTLDPTNRSAIVAAAWTDDSVRSFPAFSPKAGYGQRTLLQGVQVGGAASARPHTPRACSTACVSPPTPPTPARPPPPFLLVHGASRSDPQACAGARATAASRRRRFSSPRAAAWATRRRASTASWSGNSRATPSVPWTKIAIINPSLSPQAQSPKEQRGALSVGRGLPAASCQLTADCDPELPINSQCAGCRRRIAKAAKRFGAPSSVSQLC